MGCEERKGEGELEMRGDERALEGGKKMDYEWREDENMKNGEDGCSETRGEKRKAEERSQRQKRIRDGGI